LPSQKPINPKHWSKRKLNGKLGLNKKHLFLDKLIAVSSRKLSVNPVNIPVAKIQAD
jgi:hypothetical protein